MKKFTKICILAALGAFVLVGCGGPAVVDTSKETRALPGAKKKQALTAERF